MNEYWLLSVRLWSICATLLHPSTCCFILGIRSRFWIPLSHAFPFLVTFDTHHRWWPPWRLRCCQSDLIRSKSNPFIAVGTFTVAANHSCSENDTDSHQPRSDVDDQVGFLPLLLICVACILCYGRAFPVVFLFLWSPSAPMAVVISWRKSVGYRPSYIIGPHLSLNPTHHLNVLSLPSKKPKTARPAGKNSRAHFRKEIKRTFAFSCTIHRYSRPHSLTGICNCLFHFRNYRANDTCLWVEAHQ